MRAGGAGGEGAGKGKGLSVDKKDVVVWKLVDGVGKADFRHWCDTVYANLEAVHLFAYPEIVFDKLRRVEVEITPLNWPEVLDEASKELTKMGESHGDLRVAWSFDKGRFLWTFLLSKLNTELHGKSISIEGRNGFELFRQIVRAATTSRRMPSSSWEPSCRTWSSSSGTR